MVIAPVALSTAVGPLTGNKRYGNLPIIDTVEAWKVTLPNRGMPDLEWLSGLAAVRVSAYHVLLATKRYGWLQACSLGQKGKMVKIWQIFNFRRPPAPVYFQLEIKPVESRCIMQ